MRTIPIPLRHAHGQRRSLTSVWELAKWAPTSANIQPLRVLYVRPDEGRERLLPFMSEGNRAKTGAAPAVAVLAVDTQFHEHIPTVFPIRPEMKDMFDANEALRENGGKFNSALQAGYFILAVRASGLAAGPMTGLTPPDSTPSSSQAGGTSPSWW